jgi:putative membrane-bound dehydrogenase-like protein
MSPPTAAAPAPRSRTATPGRLGLAFALVLLLAPWPRPLARADGGLTPAEAVARMRLPEGLRAEIVAAEPDVRQPVAACFDERGRLWVVEYLQYPNPAGLKPVTVDQYLRTEYDRVPEPPPRGPRGADRVKILEDTDGDGRYETVKVFVEGLNLASAIAVGHGGVLVGQAPYLLFYPDRDRDDRPDGEPEVLLTGFGMQDAHATLNSLAWGPDGWLYGAQGSTVTAKIRGIEFQQGIWRYEPRSKRFELFAEGGGNTWGLDFDRTGEAFGSSNGGFIAFHMVPGAYYWKGFAKHGPLHNPRTFGYFDAISYDGPKAGGHVTPGGILYKADLLPPPFRGTFIGGNLLSNAVYWHPLRTDGSTFRGRHGGTLLEANDPWFRPIDLLTGPEGAVYVVDWYDRRASHLDPRDNWDKTNGRIYRIVSGEPKPYAPGDLAKLSSAELIALNDRPNDWYPDTARRLLAERRDASVVPVLRERVLRGTEPVRAMRDLWALDVSGGLDDALALRLLDHPLAPVRKWVARRLADDGRMNAELHSRLVRLAAEDPDATVRAQLAAGAGRWEARPALAVVDRLLDRDADATDPHVPLLLWWAIERHLDGDRDAALALVRGSGAQSRRLLKEHVLERLARALAQGGAPADLAGIAALLGPDPATAPGRDAVLAGLDRGLEGRRLAVPPPELAALDRALRTGADPLLIRLGLRLGFPEAAALAAARIADPRRPASERAELVARLGERLTPEVETALLDRLAADDPPEVRRAALEALGGSDRAAVAAALLARLDALPPALQARALDLLARRPSWASALLDAIAAKRIDPKRITPAQAQAIAGLGDPALVAKLEAAWGKVPGPGSEAMLRRIAEVRGILPEGDKGRAARGAAVFKQHCAVCHRLFGDGEAIGPDLTGATRNDLDFLLTSLVDPSAVVRKEYQAQTVALADGRVLTGLVVEESPAALTLLDGQRQKTTVAKAEVEESRPAAVSVMPEGLLDPLPDDQVRDLFRYLQSSDPPAP